MDKSAIETMKDVEEMVVLLAASFAMPVPQVTKGYGRVSRCYAISKNGASRLLMSVNDWHGFEDATLHEFSHAVDWFRNKRSLQHDRIFYNCLKEVIGAWYGLDQYKWENEYWTLWNFARKEGLIDKPHHRQVKRQATMPLAASSPEEVIRPGVMVEWDSKRFGRNQKGRVVSALPARVRRDDGKNFYVPQNWLRVRKDD